MHDCQDLLIIFNSLFEKSQNTLLVAGGNEPVYLPAQGSETHHRIIFTRDYFQSAMHEISHWCIAGDERRKIVDYGYWYEPDGRTAQQQALFERVEVKPQALEWIFCFAAGYRFRVSADNLSGDVSGASDEFKQNIYDQVERYLTLGFNDRSRSFLLGLNQFYNTNFPLIRDFCLESLR